MPRIEVIAHASEPDTLEHEAGAVVAVVEAPLPILIAMRLTPGEVHAVVDAASSVLPPGARVVLFGSRVDDSRRGGDLDLLLETPTSPSADEAVRLRTRFSARLYRSLGERRIDILMSVRDTPDERPVVAAARRHGIELITV